MAPLPGPAPIIAFEPEPQIGAYNHASVQDPEIFFNLDQVIEKPVPAPEIHKMEQIGVYYMKCVK